jgi:hypothetical protein
VRSALLTSSDECARGTRIDGVDFLSPILPHAVKMIAGGGH